jgi:hypothetical protein
VKIHNEEPKNCGFIARDYHWGEGEHAINNLFFYPTLEDNDSLVIWVSGDEDDYLSSGTDKCGQVHVYHSSDGTRSDISENRGCFLKGSWKGGGEFSELSDMGNYKIYYRIMLE